jgi:transcriptional regulator with GAF, ATPase, and Fis domain
MTSAGAGEGAAVGELARRVERLAQQRWAGRKPTILIGRDAQLSAALSRIARFAKCDGPVLISGETGTGKELFARALLLLGPKPEGQFLSINCAQYQDGQLLASELFGHTRGAFTGAVADHRGLFEEADGGVLFLDEVGELTLGAQAMLLRVLGEGEIVPVGSTRVRHVDVRIVAATSRDLRRMVEEGTFRSDLYYRLSCLQVVVPPVRERGDDWELIVAHYLDQLLRASGGGVKRMSADASAVMRRYGWPGNVREVKSIVATGYHMSENLLIEPLDFMEQLQHAGGLEQQRSVQRSIDGSPALTAWSTMVEGSTSFWAAVHEPYLAHELSRSDARQVIARGLDRTRGSYKRLIELFNLQEADYLKFMDFLRHQQLKPDALPPFGA